MKLISIFLLILFISGCATVPTEYRPASYYQAEHASSETAHDEPLFDNKTGALSDQDIKKILNYRLALPSKSRIAIMRMSTYNYWQFYSNDFSQLSESISENFVARLRSSPRVYDASFLPSMLLPEKRTLPYLREAAARYQADLLLAYRSQCRTFEKYKFLNPNESKASCTVEALLLDTRSGIVAFSAVSTEDFIAKKAKDDTNFQETIKKAELEAIAKALGSIAREINGFMDKVGVLK